MAEDSRVLPDLKDIETKVGRKVPESLVRSLVGGKRQEEREEPPRRCGSADVRRLEGKMMVLREEMVRSSQGRCCTMSVENEGDVLFMLTGAGGRIHFVLISFRSNFY